MKWPFIFVFSFIFWQSTFAAKICYFSLNNYKEFEVMDKFTKNLNRYAKEKIEIEEFQTEGASVEESFKKMVESGAMCDGLVISGHHTGSFGGKRGNGTLGIDFMEGLSCDPKYESFFKNIKALWLQGCRTLGVAKIEAVDTADFHTERVGAALQEDHLTQSFAQLNMEFSSTLDQDNPLSSRYLRVFPRANTFGWTKTAPGEKAASEFSIPYHMAHIAKMNDDRGRYFENPVGEQISKESAVKYLNAVYEVLKFNQDRPCFVDHKRANKGERFVHAWKAHGTPKAGSKYVFNNPDLNAYTSLYNTNDEILKKAKELECAMKSSKDHEGIFRVVDEILKNEALIGYSFHSIYEYMQRLKKEGNFSKLDLLKKKLISSELFNHFLMRKLASKELGVLRKIDYYAFYRDMVGEKVEAIEAQLNDYLHKMSITPLKESDPTQHYNQIDFLETLFNSMAKHGILKVGTLKVIVNDPRGNDVVLNSVTKVIVYSSVPIAGASEMLKTIIASPKADSITLASAASTIGRYKEPIVGVSEILKEIIASPKADSLTLSEAAFAIGRSKESIVGASEMLKTIIASPKADFDALARAASAINDSKEPIVGASEILKTIIASPKADSRTLERAASAIGDSKEPIVGASEILKTIIASPKADSNTLVYVASAIGNSKEPIVGASEILKEIIASPIADSRTLANAVFAIGNSKEPIAGASEILKQIIASPKADSYTLERVALAISNSKEPIVDASELLKAIEVKRKTLIP